jgi:hypothetical protein
MRGDARVAGRRIGPEVALLAGLLAAAAIGLLLDEIAGRGLVDVYVALSRLFAATALGYGAWLYTRKPGAVDLWPVLAVSAAVFFAAAGIIAPAAAAASPQRLSLALRALLLVALGLAASRVAYVLVAGRRTPEERARVCARVQATRVPVLLACAAVVWLLRLYMTSQGMVLSHAGDVMSEAGTGASMGIQLALLARPLALMLGAALAMDPRPHRRALGLCLVAAELLFAVLFARRLVLDVVAALLLVGLWVGRRIGPRQLAAAAVMIAFTTLVMWPFMFHMRGIADQEGLYGTAYASRAGTLIEKVIPTAISTFDLGASLDAGSAYMDNVRDRARTLDLLLDVMAAQRDGIRVMAGDVALAALTAVVPRALWPGKERLMAWETWQVEELIERHFGLPLMDMTSTVLTHGYADGGIAGVLAYMALLGALLGICERALATAGSALVGLYVYGLGLSMAVQVEANITDLLAAARVMAVLLVADRLAGRWLERQVAERRRPAAARPSWA